MHLPSVVRDEELELVDAVVELFDREGGTEDGNGLETLDVVLGADTCEG
jgi:hypothetical protein